MKNYSNTWSVNLSLNIENVLYVQNSIKRKVKIFTPLKKIKIKKNIYTPEPENPRENVTFKMLSLFFLPVGGSQETSSFNNDT